MYTDVDTKCPFCRNEYGAVVVVDGPKATEEAGGQAVSEDKKEEPPRVPKTQNKKPPKIMW